MFPPVTPIATARGAFGCCGHGQLLHTLWGCHAARKAVAVAVADKLPVHPPEGAAVSCGRSGLDGVAAMQQPAGLYGYPGARQLCHGDEEVTEPFAGAPVAG